MCYNNTTYKSPPMVRVTAGGLEPPRQLASGCQDRHVCQFHHAVSVENLGEEVYQTAPLPNPLILSIYLNMGICQGVKLQYTQII